MKKLSIFTLILAVLAAVPVDAQKRKAPAKKKKAAPAVEVVVDTKFEEMLDATQQIIFIDSVVTDKQEFLQHYLMGADAGTLAGYNQFFNSTEQPYSTVYMNQLGNKCWFAKSGRLYTSDMLGSQWSEPAPLEGLGRFQRTNYPFMLSDGTTLYFAAITDEGLGGLDIYFSRYDSESGSFLLAENLGLPFNSDANDYMYAVDELNGIGYFATDRRQPEGKVCIYTFIPNQKRVVYSSDEFSEDVIRSRAKIERIADTWGDGTAREEALERLYAESKKTEKKDAGSFTFVVNDETVYTQLSDFRNPENRNRMNELMAMKQRYEEMGAELEKARLNYANAAAGGDKASLRDELVDYEQEYYRLENSLHQLEKQIRNSELNH